jgi:hypothetical protein
MTNVKIIVSLNRVPDIWLTDGERRLDHLIYLLCRTHNFPPLTDNIGLCSRILTLTTPQQSNAHPHHIRLDRRKRRGSTAAARICRTMDTNP